MTGTLDSIHHQPSVVIFGLDDSGKPHASSFVASDTALATKAASLMGMKLLCVTTEHQHSVAERLPKGKVFASGKGFVPFVKASLFAELVAVAPEAVVPDLPVEEAGESPLGASTSSQGFLSGNLSRPAHWAEIEAGAVVLAAAATDEGWYECAVLSTEGDDQLRLQYCEWPNEPVFCVQRSQVALIHPAYQAVELQIDAAAA